MMKSRNVKFLLLCLTAFVVFACQPNLDPEPPQSHTEWIARPDGFEQNYALDQMVILSRHNIRSPLVSKNSVLTRLTNPEYQWFHWEGAPSNLTAKGERLESKMGSFFNEWLQKKDFISSYSADNYTFRFYANAKQRCQVTAKSFANALLPGKDPRVEMNVQYDTMDPVFNPQITKITVNFISKAQSEINEIFGADLNDHVKQAYTLTESVIDIVNSPAYPDTMAFAQLPSAVSFKLNAEPSMSGGLKMACTVSDALSLQYYEEPDEKKAAFGHDITFDDWVAISSIKEWYGDVLFTAPSVSVNVAHPLLQLILDEMQNQKRIFSFLCGHDSNIGSVLASLEAEDTDLPGSIEKRTPIGCKLIFETFTGKDGVKYADILLVYATAAQLRAESTLSYSNPPAGIKIKLKGLKENADGLYTLADVQQRLSKAIVAYDNL
ncbi:MAG: histidine-type phosphatase [Bacteroidales bacterium]|nr:histidine-type phosphatase [Bacteroidales bacterium]